MAATALPTLPPLLDLLGTAIFALSGALLAARLRQTFVTMTFFALITGVGGGSVRDLLIGAPVFWVRDPWVAPVCLGVALIASAVLALLSVVFGTALLFRRRKAIR